MSEQGKSNWCFMGTFWECDLKFEDNQLFSNGLYVERDGSSGRT